MPVSSSLWRAVLAGALLAFCTAQAQSKPRLLVTTDIGGDPDDQQSMRRLMLYSNEVELTGLIASAAGTAGELPNPIVRPDLIHAIVNDYETVQPNPAKHATGYPLASTLRVRVKSGSPNRGVANLGAGRSTEGSNSAWTPASTTSMRRTRTGPRRATPTSARGGSGPWPAGGRRISTTSRRDWTGATPPPTPMRTIRPSPPSATTRAGSSSSAPPSPAPAST
ncbi:nucleoside hydrolase-like domain-containing protein [Pyxidicoccus xibeiensis]|uniref:nucleoside hydrolase-like domain-containing protein n=1 Tax=Pyxidicoccus xibeiensis TaxID=2906759 RepID=UPI0020A6F8CA|nr:nucleoside hydrolase-like domain-containing protein [Pyxidicoccus xibeiensis]MCP3143338.1 DUF1593 domain-containing protein [Pyxidicoccus xibeiensis]